jgi:hypothetical protein
MNSLATYAKEKTHPSQGRVGVILFSPEEVA